MKYDKCPYIIFALLCNEVILKEMVEAFRTKKNA